MDANGTERVASFVWHSIPGRNAPSRGDQHRAGNSETLVSCSRHQNDRARSKYGAGLCEGDNSRAL